MYREELESILAKLNFIPYTTNVTLNWNSYLRTLAPKEDYTILRLKRYYITVEAVLEPMVIPTFSLIGGEKSVVGSPLGSPAFTRTILDF